jgi:hypothetical protein
VFLVQGEDVVGEAAADLGGGSREVEGSPEEWTWVVAQRVEVEVVDGVREDAAGCLQSINGKLPFIHVY